MENLKSLLAGRTGWFWVGVVVGFLTPILIFQIYQQGQSALEDREAQNRAEEYPEVESEDFHAIGDEFAEELVRVFGDLSDQDVTTLRELEIRGCPATDDRANYYVAELRATDYQDSSQLQAAIDEVDSLLEDAPEWSFINHAPATGDSMGRWETWSYEWEHDVATIEMELAAQDRADDDYRMVAKVESDCYHADISRDNMLNRFGPEELE